MNLTNLRRLVLALDVLALGAAGAAAWYSLKAPPAAARDWQKLFPVKSTAVVNPTLNEPGPKDIYTGACAYSQGEKPVPVVVGPAVEPVKVDDFLTKYRLNGIMHGRTMECSFVQLKIGSGPTEQTFSVGLGERIPAEIGTKNLTPPLTPWRLNDIKEPVHDTSTKQTTPAVAIFLHVDTGESKELKMEAGNPIILQNPESPTADIIGEVSKTGPVKGQGFVGRILKSTPDQIEIELPEGEIDYLGAFSADEISALSTTPSHDASGAPDGFVLKGVPATSRAHDVGFQQEDKVVSVNGEKVTSTADAMSKGKAQYEGGTSVFQLKILRKGKEMSFTFHAPKKKAKP